MANLHEQPTQRFVAMSIKGFHPRWKDLPDGIIGITKEMWDDRGIATLQHDDTPDLIKRSPAGVVVGSQTGITETMMSTGSVPDMQIVVEGGPDKAAKPVHPAMDVQGKHLRRGGDNAWGPTVADQRDADTRVVMPDKTAQATRGDFRAAIQSMLTLPAHRSIEMA
jgi:hypothetical protein